MPSREGSPNRNKSFLLNRLKKMYGDDFHPIMNMAANAVKLQEAADAEPEANNFKAAIDGWDKIAQYVEPKLKAVEVNADVNVQAIDMSGWSDEQIDAYINRNSEG